MTHSIILFKMVFGEQPHSISFLSLNKFNIFVNTEHWRWVQCAWQLLAIPFDASVSFGRMTIKIWQLHERISRSLAIFALWAGICLESCNILRLNAWKFIKSIFSCSSIRLHRSECTERIIPNENHLSATIFFIMMITQNYDASLRIIHCRKFF